jgi:hypothetical protein
MSISQSCEYCIRRVLHCGDAGVSIGIRVVENGVPVDISSATLMRIYLKSPDGDTVKCMTAGFKTDGSDGILEYVTVAVDLDEPGEWTIQGFVEFGVYSLWTDMGKFLVECNVTAKC